jgi:hypothetical protein
MEPPLKKRKSANGSRKSGEMLAILGFVTVSESHIDKLYTICETTESDRNEKDFIYKMAQGEHSEFHCHWYSIMAHSLLRTIRVIHNSSRGSLIAELMDMLFKIKAPSNIEWMKEVPYEDNSDQARMIESIGVVASTLLNYVEMSFGGAMRGDHPQTRKARASIARTAMFFICLHYDLSLLDLILSPRSNINFFNHMSMVMFVRVALFDVVSAFVNGTLEDPVLFVTACMTAYTRDTNIDPYALVPLALKPPEDPSVLSREYARLLTPNIVRGHMMRNSTMGIATGGHKSNLLIGYKRTDKPHSPP